MNKSMKPTFFDFIKPLKSQIDKNKLQIKETIVTVK